MSEQRTARVRLDHAEPEQLARLAGFSRQEGCAWRLIGEEETGVPDLIISRQGVFLNYEGKHLAFHPSMALIRMINLLRGESDRFLAAADLQAGDTLLDTTLGLGSDALIGAWAVGDKGRVLALERSPLLAAFIQDGLKHFSEIVPRVKNKDKERAWAALSQAAGSIEVRRAEHGAYLRNMPSRAVDVVYFDPMFRRTVKKSGSVLPLHSWAEHKPLASDAVKEACRVARRRVVLKERKDSPEFERLGFKVLSGGLYSPVDYGVIETRQEYEKNKE